MTGKQLRFILAVRCVLLLVAAFMVQVRGPFWWTPSMERAERDGRALIDEGLSVTSRKWFRLAYAIVWFMMIGWLSLVVDGMYRLGLTTRFPRWWK